MVGGEYLMVGDLDPLCADDSCAAVPTLNAQADVAALARAVRSLIPTQQQIEAFSLPEALAAMRDLGLYLGSLKRHGAEPLRVVPDLEAPLRLLGVRTSMVPRDTVYHYATWNPQGHRQRMYVGSPQEDALIWSVRMAIPELESAIRLLASLIGVAPEDPSFAATLRQTAIHLQAMVRAIDLVRAEVSADYFARVMRPYFESVSIAGVSYFGPAAAHMPLHLVDTMLWGDSCEGYRSFQNDSVKYSPPHWRQLFEHLHGQMSITSVVVEALAAARGAPTPEIREDVDALCSLYRLLITFRGRHLVLARAAYHVERRLYATGSGGGSVQLLEAILDLTREYARVIRPGCLVASESQHLAYRRSVQP